jgi:hypothetical protein
VKKDAGSLLVILKVAFIKTGYFILSSGVTAVLHTLLIKLITRKENTTK